MVIPVGTSLSIVITSSSSVTAFTKYLSVTLNVIVCVDCSTLVCILFVATKFSTFGAIKSTKSPSIVLSVTVESNVLFAVLVIGFLLSAYLINY